MARTKQTAWDAVRLSERSFRTSLINSADYDCSLCGRGIFNGYALTPLDPSRAELPEIHLCGSCLSTLTMDIMRLGDPAYAAMIDRKEWEQGIVPRDVEGYKARIAILDKELDLAFSDYRSSKSEVKKSIASSKLDGIVKERLQCLADLRQLVLPAGIITELDGLVARVDQESDQFTADRPIGSEPQPSPPSDVRAFVERSQALLRDLDERERQFADKEGVDYVLSIYRRNVQQSLRWVGFAWDLSEFGID